MKLVAAIVLVALLGCNPKPTAILGGVLVAGGTVIVATAPPEDGNFHLFGSPHDNAIEAGSVFLVTGVILGLIGLVQYGMQTNAEEKQARARAGIVAPPAPFPVTAEPPPEFVDPAEAPPRPVPGIAEPPLPAESLLFDNPSQRQFALQASSAARRGRCAAAIASGKRLTVENDQKLLAADAAYARCVENH